ncbi:MAG TPA: GNAT family N-acetyltransferase, partial [Anaerolineales bacterium]|nr:GNAT family N-acetyltransferase [Anaerolineales bacterium]
MASYQIREMVIDDYDAIIVMFHETPGIMVRDADSRESTAAYLTRNPGLSFVATINGKIIGCVMSGHDGRRGY